MDILLLHGAIGAASQLLPLKALLTKSYKVHTLDFTGHGGKPFGNEPFSIKLFADDVISYMDEHQISKVNILGYSMGGYVGMYIAKHHPERIDKIITLATKYNWNETIAAKEVQMLNPEKIAQKLPAFAETR
jgi:pimeloyl-ACP methyl ester carboxylesterase